jgi:hypothetical protein
MEFKIACEANMSACKQQVFDGITQSRWDCIKKAVQGKTGIVISTDSGNAAKSGFSVEWNFDAPAKTLSIQCVEKPIVLSCTTIEGLIAGLVDGCP